MSDSSSGSPGVSWLGMVWLSDVTTGSGNQSVNFNNGTGFYSTPNSQYPGPINIRKNGTNYNSPVMPSSISANVWHHFTLKAGSSGNTTVLIDNNSYSINAGSSYDLSGLSLYMAMVSNTWTNPHLYWLDNVRVRKYAFPEPTVVTGTPKSIFSSGVVSSTAHMWINDSEVTSGITKDQYGITCTSYTLNLGQNPITVTITDAAGNIITATWIITYDSTPPINCSILINNGTGYTTSQSVTLNLYAEDPQSGSQGLWMRFSNDNEEWSEWLPYAAVYNYWQLTSGDGTKTVYAQYKNGAGLISEGVIYDTILLDTTAPTGSIAINNGDWVTTSTTGALTLSADDAGGSGVSEMNISNGVTSTGWITYTTSYNCYLGSALGTKTISVQYKDAGGLTSSVYSDTIVLAQDHQGQDWELADQDVISGIHYNIVNFSIPSGVVYTTQGEILEINANNMWITGTLSANGKGYGYGEGPGQGESGYYGGGGGAGYGGTGGRGAGPEPGEGGIQYGNPLSPIEPGSCGGPGSDAYGGNGGGVIRLNAIDAITVTGSVSANGANGDYGNGYGGSGAGSGGSLWVRSNLITGTGTLTAIGGNGGIDFYYDGTIHDQCGGPGAGGRIKLDYTTITLPRENVSVNPGTKEIHEYWDEYYHHYYVPCAAGNAENGTISINGKEQEPPNDTTPVTKNDPIYITTGEFYQETTDLTIPGRGMPFKFTRKYRAQSWYDGPLGYGWDFNYNMRIENIGPSTTVNGADVNFYDGAGRIDKYNFAVTTGNNASFTTPDGFYNILEYYSVTDTYTIYESNGTKYTFGANPLISNVYQLTTISDRNDNTITCTYDANARMDSVIDTLGRVISFYYNANSRIDYFKDWEDRVISFTYTAEGDLASVTSPTTDEYPDGKTTEYTYTSNQDDIRMNHKMLTIKDPKHEQPYLINYYDEKGRVIEQTYGGGTFHNEYYEATESEPAVVRVTDRKGNVSDSWLTPQGNVSAETKYANGIMPEDVTTTYEHITTTERSATIFPNGNSIEYLYDINNANPRARGNLLSITRKADGEDDITTSFTYETHYNQIKSSTDAKGKTITYYYDWEEIQNTIDYNEDGQYGPDHGNVVKIVYPNVTQPASQTDIYSTFAYNNSGQITVSRDPEGIKTYYEYYTSTASEGYLKKVIRNYEATPTVETEYTYDSVGNITSIKDARLHTTIFTVNQLNQVTTTTSRAPFSYQVGFSYDANDNLLKTSVENKDEDGNPDGWIDTNYTYDTLDNMATKEETISSTLTATTTYSRDSNENLTTVTHPEENQSYTSYDERDLVYQSAAGFGSANPVTATNFYDLNGNLIETRIGDGSKGTLYYEYDGFDRRNKVTDKLGNYTVTEYDDNSNVTRVARYSPAPESLLLSEVYYDYDELNRMYKITAKKFDTPGGTGNPADVITTFWYDKKGRKWKTETTRNYQTIATTTDYDNLDRVTRVTDPVGNKVEYTDYDGNGNPWTITETEKRGESEDVFVTTNVYDNLDRLTSSTNSLGTMEYKYDSRNNNKHTTDRENHITRREYDLMNRLNENIYQLATGDISVKYGLDKNGRLVTLTDDNNNLTEYEYDSVNRRETERLPDTTTKQYTFTQYGTLDQMTDNNGSIVTHNYDNALRLTGKTINRATGVYGTTFENFGYDGLGQMTSAQNDDSTVSFSYDSFGNVLKETQNGKEVESTYDVLSFRTQLEYPGGTKTINFTPDDLNRITSITQNSQPIAQYAYAGPGRVTGRSYLNGTGLTVTYDTGRRPTSYSHGATIGGFEYSFDKMNNKLFEKRTFDSKGEAFKYDEIYRLTGVKYGVTNLTPGTDYSVYAYEREVTYQLDGVGNREEVATTLWEQQPTTVPYAPNTLNQYGAINGSTLDHDVNGNLRWDGVITCTYNYANQLIKVIRSDDEQVLGEYKYDASGRRIYKKAWNEDTESFIETYFYYDGGHCIEERNSGDTVIATYVFGNMTDEVLTMERNSETYYFHENSLGSIYAVTTGTGNVAERYLYNAYGQVSFLDANGNSIVSSTIGNRILFTSREFDSETGLYYYRARYYSAEQGRFINRDPAADDNLGNLYAYVGNNPYGFTDPLGLKWHIDRTGEERAVAWSDTPEKDDFEGLAKEAKMDYAKLEKWLQHTDKSVVCKEEKIKPGKAYTVPNVILISVGYDKEEIRNRWLKELMKDIDKLEDGYKYENSYELGYDISNTKDLFGCIFIGHGRVYTAYDENDDIKSATWSGEILLGVRTVGVGPYGPDYMYDKNGEPILGKQILDPKNITVPYKLGLIQIHACGSLGGNWNEYVSPNGQWALYEGVIDFGRSNPGVSGRVDKTGPEQYVPYKGYPTANKQGLDRLITRDPSIRKRPKDK
jgi:RHS repeat-associated protein